MDRYVANLYVRPPTPQILDFGGRFWILGILGISDLGSWGFRILDFGFCGDFGFWILGPKSKIQNPPIQNPKSKLFLDLGDFGFWIVGILDFGFWGFWILDFGFWILDRYVASLYVRPPTPQIWGILDFGFWGFWGFWILEFGDFGFWILGQILDSTEEEEDCARRPGSADLQGQTCERNRMGIICR